jgi:hypothetical protein
MGLSLVMCPTELIAQALSKPIILDPISEAGVDAVTVHNIYGKCGPSVVQVLGVREQNGDFYSIDASSDTYDILLIREPRRQLSLKKFLSDYNGVDCLTSGSAKKLLVWSNCAGSACGYGYSFVVVDPEDLEIVAGEDGNCNSLCAARILGSDLPLKIDNLKLQSSRP